MPVGVLEEEADEEVAVAAHELRARHGELVLDPARPHPGPHEPVQRPQDLPRPAAHHGAPHLPPLV